MVTSAFSISPPIYKYIQVQDLLDLFGTVPVGTVPVGMVPMR